MKLKQLGIRIAKYFFNIFRSYILFNKDRCRFVDYSGMLHQNNSEVKMLSDIAMKCHIIEKGLTMPDMKLGFGIARVVQIIQQCNNYITSHNSVNCQLLHAVGVLKEYLSVHQRAGFQFKNGFEEKINELVGKVNCIETCQLITSQTDYFANKLSSFDLFSASRHSLRHFSNEDINITTLIDAVKLAQNAPSSCNRQQARAYIVDKKEAIEQVLKCQNGHRGFGYLSNKLIVVTASVEEYNGILERNSAYIDGGLFMMNLLYALHFFEIGACTLNANFSSQKEKVMRNSLGVPKSEVFLAVIALGKAPKQFKVALSKRNNVEQILKVI